MNYEDQLNELNRQIEEQKKRLEAQMEEQKRRLEAQMQAMQSSFNQWQNPLNDPTVSNDTTNEGSNDDDGENICPECGENIIAGARFCPMCGCSLTNHEEQEDEFVEDDDDNSENEDDSEDESLFSDDDDFEDDIYFEDDDDEVGGIEYDDFDFNIYEGYAFIYRYTSGGEEIEREVVVACANDGTFYMDDEGFDLKQDSFSGLIDIDDCGIVIAKHIIDDNDGEVRMTLIKDGDNESTLTEVPYEVRLDKHLNYVDTNDESWTLCLGASEYIDAIRCDIYELDDEEDSERIKECIEEEDTDELEELLGDYSEDVIEILNIVGDRENERLNYELTDNEGNTISEGEILIDTDNIFEDPDRKDCYGTHHHPWRVLVKTDSIKRSWATFNVPANFEVGGIHFILQNDLPNSLGAQLTNHFYIRHAGKYYHADVDDAGTLGDIDYYLFEWDEDMERYRVIARSN